MKLSVTCDECDTEYRVSQTYAGKKIRCKQCDAVLQVPSGVEDDEGDDWDAPIGSSKSKRASSGLPPKPKKPKKQPAESTKSKKKQKVSPETANMMIYLFGILAVLVILTIVGLYNPNVFLWGGIALLVIGNFATYCHACENECGFLYRLIPGYSIYYTLCYLSELWHWGVMRVGGGSMLIASLIIFAWHGRQADLQRMADLKQPALSISVESYQLGDDEIIDPNEKYEDVNNPSAEVLKEKISGLPWENKEVICSAALRPGYESDDQYEYVTLLGTPGELRPGEPLQLQWERLVGDEGFTKSSPPFAKVDDALPYLEKYLAGQPEWDSGIEWVEGADGGAGFGDMDDF